MKTISIIIATMGRPELADTIASVARQLRLGDEIIVVWDGKAPDDYGLPACHQLRLVSDMTPGPSQYGNRQRNRGMLLATADYICFLDDDDWHLKGSLDHIRTAGARQETPIPMMFRAIRPGGHIVWQDREVRRTNVGTCTIVVPNIQSKFAEWPVMQNPPEGISPRTTDFDFIDQTVKNFGGVEFHDAIIYECGNRPPKPKVKQ